MTTPKYTIVNGTSYDVRTPEAVVRVLEHCRITGDRLRLHYGDQATGRDWMEESGVSGTVGRSMGPIQVPLLIHNRRSTGGGHILDHCIVKITSKPFRGRGRVPLYQHPKYNLPKLTIHNGGHPEYSWEVWTSETSYDGVVHARFKTLERAEKFIRTMKDR